MRFGDQLPTCWIVSIEHLKAQTLPTACNLVAILWPDVVGHCMKPFEITLKIGQSNTVRGFLAARPTMSVYDEWRESASIRE